MSPARAMPTVETVPEARDTDQEPNGQQREQEAAEDHRGPEQTAPENSRLPSIKDDCPLRRYQTGSPQLHPLLKPRPRSRDRRRSSGIPVVRPDTHRRASADFAWHGFEEDHAGSSASDLERRSYASQKPAKQQRRERLSLQHGFSGLPLPAVKANAGGSSSSNGSTSKRTTLAGTVPEPQAPAAQHGASVQAAEPPIPDFLDKLNEDAPAGVEGEVQQGVAETASWSGANNEGKASPSAQSATSSSSSTSGSPYSDLSSERTTDTERSCSPERGVEGDETPVAPLLNFVEHSLHAASKRRSSLFDVDRYGTPEMPRGTANLPHIPCSALTPRMPNQGHHPKHLPRAEKLPLSGYELLASRISASSSSEPGPRSHPDSGSSSSTATPSGHVPRRHSSASNFAYRNSLSEPEPTIKPIYRRFKAMNHRILLQLQDELSELEEQLHRLDTADTQTRRVQDRILPASRRAESQAGGELQSHKTAILAKIGLKLGQYNHAMASFTATRDIPSPSPSDVSNYRRYLAIYQPVTEVESRFLDSTDDLVTLAPPTRASPLSRAPSPPAGGAMAAAAAAAAARDQHYFQALKTTLADSASASATTTTTTPAPAPSPAHGGLSEPEPSSPIPIPGTMHGNSWRRGHVRGSNSVNHIPSPGLLSSGGGLAWAPPSSPRGPRSRPRSSSEAVTSPSFAPRSGTPPVGPRAETAAAAAAAPGAVPTIKVDQPSSSPGAAGEAATKGAGPGSASPVVLHVAIALAVAVLLPVLAFPTIPGLVGRLIVVALVGVSVAGSVVQSGSVGASAAGAYSKDLFLSIAVYTGVMVVVAGML